MWEFCQVCPSRRWSRELDIHVGQTQRHTWPAVGGPDPNTPSLADGLWWHVSPSQARIPSPTPPKSHLPLPQGTVSLGNSQEGDWGGGAQSQPCFTVASLQTRSQQPSGGHAPTPWLLSRTPTVSEHPLTPGLTQPCNPQRATIW